MQPRADTLVMHACRLLNPHQLQAWQQLQRAPTETSCIRISNLLLQTFANTNICVDDEELAILKGNSHRTSVCLAYQAALIIRMISVTHGKASAMPSHEMRRFLPLVPDAQPIRESNLAGHDCCSCPGANATRPADSSHRSLRHSLQNGNQVLA